MVALVTYGKEGDWSIRVLSLSFCNSRCILIDKILKMVSSFTQFNLLTPWINHILPEITQRNETLEPA